MEHQKSHAYHTLRQKMVLLQCNVMHHTPSLHILVDIGSASLQVLSAAGFEPGSTTTETGTAV